MDLKVTEGYSNGENYIMMRFIISTLRQILLG
jgi:hypothetical protein